MRRLKRLVPGHDFRDEVSVVPVFATPKTDLFCHDQLFLDDSVSTKGLGLKDAWTTEEQCITLNNDSYLPPTPPLPSRSTETIFYTDNDFKVDHEARETEYTLELKPKWSKRVKSKLRKLKDHRIVPQAAWPSPKLDSEPQPIPATAIDAALMIRSMARSTKVLKPLDALADLYPSTVGFVLVTESLLVTFALYEIYILIDGVFKTIKAILFPLLLIAKLFDI